MSAEKRALGRGLSTLLPTRKPEPAAKSEVAPALETGAPLRVPLERIDPNPLQPRSEFDPAAMQELADSIRVHGVIQPLVTRRKGERFEIVAGERRWRASRMAGLIDVPVVILDLPDSQVLQVALIENIQRADLNPIEVAQALDQLQKEGMTQEALALSTGKDRSTISNFLRLLRLPKDVQTLISERRLSAGHAKVVCGLPTDDLQSDVAQRIVVEGLSVRETERLVKKMLQPRTAAGTEVAERPKIDPNVQAAIDELESVLGTRVRIVEKGKGGRLEIEYYSPEDLDRIYDQIVGTKE